MSASNYGGYYYCVVMKDEQLVYFHADDVEVRQDGTLCAVRKKEGERDRVMLAVRAPQWTRMFAASCLDGHAVSVEEHSQGAVMPEGKEQK